jgi:hypothetical protein
MTTNSSEDKRRQRRLVVGRPPRHIYEFQNVSEAVSNITQEARQRKYEELVRKATKNNSYDAELQAVWRLNHQQDNHIPGSDIRGVETEE